MVVGPFSTEYVPSSTATSTGMMMPPSSAVIATYLPCPTAQREIVYKAILGKRNHPSADEIFARQVWGLGQKGDLLIAFTSSGKSRNILRALEEAVGRQRWDTFLKEYFARFAFGTGRLSAIPSRWATHIAASGQRAQPGRLRVQSVAPRSMIACV